MITLPTGFEVDPETWGGWEEPEFILIQANKKKDKKHENSFF
jgi:hypothetical protein